MTTLTFEQHLHHDIDAFRSHSASPVEIQITRCGELSDDGVSAIERWV